MMRGCRIQALMPAEIAARAQSGLILRRQAVEQFWQDNAFHEVG